MSAQEQVYRFFTGARRIPLMVGRTITGEKIWGGPYRITQFVVAGVVVFILWVSHSIGLWGSPNVLVDLGVGVVLAGGIGFLAGKLPMTKRSAWSMTRSTMTALRATPAGTYRGASVELPRPRRKRFVPGRDIVPKPKPQPVEPEPEAEPVEEIPAPASVSRPAAATAVDALLAQVQHKAESENTHV